MAVGQEIQVIYYPIREDMARRAKEMNSFSGYIEGTATAEYRRCVDQAVEAAKHQKEKVDPIYHGKIDALVDTYARKLADELSFKTLSWNLCGNQPENRSRKPAGNPF